MMGIGSPLATTFKGIGSKVVFGVYFTLDMLIHLVKR